MSKPLFLVAMEFGSLHFSRGPKHTSSHSVPKASALPTAEAANTAELK